MSTNSAPATSTAATGRPKMTAKRVTVVSITILFVAWIVDYVDRLVISTALPSIGREFGLDHGQQGLLLTVFFISYALFQFPGGLLADKLGPKRTMVIALVAWSVFTGLTGLAVSFGMLIIVRVLFGVTEGIFPGASMKAMTERSRPAQRMTANGIMLGSNPFGAALAPLIAAPVITAVGWQNSFFSVAAAGCVVAVVVWFALPKPLPDTLTTDGAAPSTPTIGVRGILRRGVLWRFGLMFGGFDLVAWGLTSWVPGYLQTVKHVSTNASGVLASIPFFCATAGTVLGGVCYDRFFHGRHRLLIIPSCVVSGIFLLLMVLAADSTGMFIFYQSISMLVLYLSFMPIFGLPLRLLPREIVGSAAGLVNMGGQIAGAIAPFIMGFLADTVSFDAAFLFLEVGLVVAIGATLWAPQRPADLNRHFPELSPTP